MLPGLASEAQTYEQTHKTYWLYSIIKTLRADTDQKFMASYLLVIYIGLMIVAPAACLVGYLVFWFVRMPEQTHRKFVSSLKYLYCWVAPDVIWAASVASVLEMGLVAKWIAQDKFGFLCDEGAIVEQLVGLECLGANGSLLSGSWVMLAVAIMCPAALAAVLRSEAALEIPEFAVLN